MGGLLKRLPWTGALFLLGAVAICGLPPLNGFVSELLLAGAALLGVTGAPAQTATAGLVALACLGLIGGLAATTFAKAFGMVFLGEPRRSPEAEPHEAGFAMKSAMVLLALGCVVVAFGAAWVLRCVAPIIAGLAGKEVTAVLEELHFPCTVLMAVAACGLVLVAFTVVFALVRGALLAGRKQEEVSTWGCGYARPSARMQYTGSSFAQPVTNLFRWLLGVRYELRRPEGVLPVAASLATDAPDLCHGNLYHPAFLKANWGLSKLRWLQQGQVQLYVLYITVSLIVLFLWKFH